MSTHGSETADQGAIGFLHEITEPGSTEPLRLYSGSGNNPWSHWVARHRERCEYKCTPLYARAEAPPISSLLTELLAYLKSKSPGPSCECCADLRAVISKIEAALASQPKPTKFRERDGVFDDYEGVAQPKPAEPEGQAREAGSWGVGCTKHGFTPYMMSCPECKAETKTVSNEK